LLRYLFVRAAHNRGSVSMAQSIANEGFGVTTMTGIVAGAAGGLAEIAWVGLYATTTGGNAAAIAQGVTTAAGVDALFPHAATAAGIGLHMALSLALGVALAIAARHLGRSARTVSLAALFGVWCVNFFVILPLVSPAFTHLLPYAVSLTSKLLFGIAAGQVLAMQTRRLPRGLAVVRARR
jgi:hypothetical protein